MITILIADDNAVSLELVADALAAPGYRIVEASNGNDALAKVRSERPQLVLLDIQMPELNGFEVLRQIRALDPTVRCQILALTAFAMEGDRERVLAAGFDGYIAKPISITKVRETVRRLLNLQSHSATHEI